MILWPLMSLEVWDIERAMARNHKTQLFLLQLRLVHHTLPLALVGPDLQREQAEGRCSLFPLLKLRHHGMNLLKAFKLLRFAFKIITFF